ncbi:MAG: cytochrome c3 family protein [Desulfobacterales bacterium]
MPEKDKIQAYRESGKDIPWLRVNRVRPDIYGLDTLLGGIPNRALAFVFGGEDRINFSHRLHVSVGNVDCSQCHGDIAGMDKPITQPFVEMDMDFCMSCHQAQEELVASVDCAACHR